MIELTRLKITNTFDPKSEEQEILRNARVILSTVKGQVVLDRDFGMNPDLLDMPIPDAESYFIVEATEQLRKYESRANIQDVFFESDMHGNFIPKVVIEIASEFT